ncbi:Nucleotidyltransferase domain containing protein [Novymonas esmeraldas]|uniref:Nucleotidyltransferase domain containing protein n=1 Tax=Novymonas esmeraldas TaxID=1808958 RepID=A0AAW0F4W7_9TRYP
MGRRCASRAAAVNAMVAPERSSSACASPDAGTPTVGAAATSVEGLRGRLHRRGRGRNGDGLSGRAARRCESNRQPASGAAAGVAGVQSSARCAGAAGAVPPLDSAACARAMEAQRLWSRHAWGGGVCVVAAVLAPFPGAPAVLVAPPVPLAPALAPVRLPPWCRSVSATAYPLSEDGLTNELVDLFHYLDLTPQEEAARARLLERVRGTVAELWGPSAAEGSPSTGSADVMLYGSYAIGLSLPSSDIDLALTFPDEERAEAAVSAAGGGGDSAVSQAAVEAAQRRQAVHLERLHDLAKRLQKSTALPPLEVQVYDQCRVPRIHLRDWASSGVSCDINSSFVSARVARIVARQRLWLQDTPLAVFLARITKAAVKQWRLSEVFRGGVASTALYCLVLRFLAQLEQLHQHAPVEEENLSPPQYEEAAAATRPPASTPSPTVHLSVSTSVRVTAAAAAVDAAGAATLQAAVDAPSYVPSWATSGTRCGRRGSSPPVCRRTGEDGGGAARQTPVPALALPTEMGASASISSPTAVSTSSSSSVSRWGSGNSVCGEDEEVDGYTQGGLTRSSGSATAATTPLPRTAASTPPPPGSDSDTPRSSGVAPPPPPPGCFPTTADLTRVARARYGASPARLLLKLWRFLSDEVFLGGYQVADVFGDDAVWDDGGVPHGNAATPSASLPSASSLERATFAGMASSDLSAASFRIPELLSLFRCSSTSLESMLRYQHYPNRAAPTMLSTVFVDPRQPSCA